MNIGGLNRTETKSLCSKHSCYCTYHLVQIK